MRPSLPFQSHLRLLNLPKLLFTERQLGSYNQKKKSQQGGQQGWGGPAGEGEEGGANRGGGGQRGGQQGEGRGSEWRWFFFFKVLPPFLGGG